MKMLLAGLMMVPVVGFAHSFEAGDLKIGHPWTRATPAGSKVAAGYLTVTNSGKTGDVLQGATVDGVGHVMVHSISNHHGMAHMEEMEGGAAVKPGETLTLAPGGVHLMWMDLKAPFKAGELVSGTLQFKNAGAVPVQFKVEAAGAREPAHKH